MFITVKIWSFVIFAIAALFSLGFYYMGRDDEKRNEKMPKLLILLAFILLFVLIDGLLTHRIGRGVRKQEMRRRLNEPIASFSQLYGYEVVSKSFRQNKYLGNSSAYLITVKDLLEMPGIFLQREESEPILLKNIEVSKNFFPKLLPRADTNIPAMEDQ